jgi:uncharacterized protein YdiU (UPF0061 family)
MIKKFFTKLLRFIFTESELQEIVRNERAVFRQELAQERERFKVELLEGVTNHTDAATQKVSDSNSRFQSQLLEAINDKLEARFLEVNDTLGKTRKEMKQLGRPYVKMDAEQVVKDYLKPMNESIANMNEEFMAFKRTERNSIDSASKVAEELQEHKKAMVETVQLILESLKVIKESAPAPTVKRLKQPLKRNIKTVSQKKVPVTSKKKATKRK